MSHRHSGVLLIRVWMEGDPPRLRARIIRRDDATGPDQSVSVATTASGVHAAVDAWLQTFPDNKRHS